MKLYCNQCGTEVDINYTPTTIPHGYVYLDCTVCKASLVRVKKCYRCGDWGMDPATKICYSCRDKDLHGKAQPSIKDSEELTYRVKCQLLRGLVEDYITRVEAVYGPIDCTGLKALLEQI